MKPNPLTSAKLFEIVFRDEAGWRQFLDQFVQNNPLAYLEPTGTWGFLVQSASVSWIKAHIDSASYLSLSAVKVGNDSDDDGGVDDRGTFQDRGKALRPDYDDPDWLTRETERLEKENDRLRRRIGA